MSCRGRCSRRAHRSHSHHLSRGGSSFALRQFCDANRSDLSLLIIDVSSAKSDETLRREDFSSKFRVLKQCNQASAILHRMAYHDFTWLDKVSTAVGLPRPSCAEELTALLDMAVEQELSCVVKSLPLRRAPGIDNSVDIGAALLSTFGTELTFGTPPGGELLGHRGRHTDIGSRSGEIRWSDMRELLIDDASDDFTLADQLSCHQSSEL